MSNIVWESVDIKQSSHSSGEKFASIGQGRISLSSAACSLLDNIYSYEWVNILQGKDGNKVVMIGLRFTKTKEKNSLRALRRKYKGQIVEGNNINSKPLIKKFFGETKETSTSRYAVEKVNDNTIAINILKEM